MVRRIKIRRIEQCEIRRVRAPDRRPRFWRDHDDEAGVIKNMLSALMKNYIKRMGQLAAYRDFFRHYILGLYRRIEEHHVLLMAGGLAFSLFACIVPMIFIIFSILGMVLNKPTIAVEIGALIDRLIPYADQSATIKRIILARVDEFRVFKSAAGAIGLVGIVIASSGLFGSMRTILNRVYKVSAKKFFLIGKLRDLGLVLLVLLYFLLSTTVLPSLEILQRFADRTAFLHWFQMSGFEDFTAGIISFLIILLGFFTLYLYIPHTKLPRRVVAVSALSAAVLWEIAKQLFSYYVTHAVTLKKVYGAYTLIIVSAFWIYYTSIVFIVGAEIGQLFRERLRKSDEAHSGQT